VTVAADANTYVKVKNIPCETGALEVTAEVTLQYTKEYYTPVYKTSTAAVVSYIGGDLPACIAAAGSVNNGFTWLNIDVALLEAAGEDGVDIGLGTSNPANTYQGFTYNLKIVDGQLVVTCNIVSGAFGVVLSKTLWTVNPNSLVKFNNQSTYDLTNLVDSNGCVYFFIHTNGSSTWFAGWALASIELISEPYTGDLTMTVTNVADDTVVYDGVLGLVEDLVPGDYVVKLFADGAEIDSADATVEAGQTTSVSFNSVVGGPTVKIY
jgi:hypothetical protein